MDQRSEPVPEIFCWTRFGAEAGEGIDSIIARKETERVENGGVFYWGIGNPVAPGIAELVRQCATPEVLFSPIKGRPRRVDVEPETVVRWHAASDPSGRRFTLPSKARVTSRSNRSLGRARHYALVCAVEEPLEFDELGRLRFIDLRNLLSGRPVGASQVTAVVSRARGEAEGEYVIALRARLVAPYFVQLHDPSVVTQGSEQVAA